MVPQEASSELELRDYLRLIRRRKWTILLTTLVVVGAALVASFLKTPVYEGTAELLLQPASAESLFNPTTGQRVDPERAVQTEIQVLESQPVRTEVRRRIGAAPEVSASPVGLTDVIEVRARSTSPRRAAEIANTYAESYIDFRRRQAVEGLLAAGREIQAKLSDLQAQADALDRRIAEAPPAQQAGVSQELKPRRDSLLQQISLFRQRLDQLQVEASLKTGGAQLVTPASVPTSPVEPKPARNGVLGLAVGLMLGAGFVFLSEYVDDSIKDKEDVERVVRDAPVIGLVPVVPNWKDRGRPLVVSLTEPSSPAAEAYRSLRTSIQFMGLDRPLRTLQFTSPAASEGKTTTMSNLGVALARAGQRVVLVDCDLRRPRLHEFFGLSNTAGFTSLLLGDASAEAALQRVPGEEHLWLLASGPLPPNPSELLSGKRAVELLSALQGEADIVLVDTPPVLPVTDAAVLSSRVDGTVLVATAGTTHRKELGRAYELLRQLDASVVGVVLNGVSTEGTSYGYGYTPHEVSENGRRGQRAKQRSRR